MQPTNQPLVATAQSWVGELDVWLDQHGVSGYDPFDIKECGPVRRVQASPPLRKLTTALCDLFPVTSRRLMGVRPTVNPKAHALVALGKLRLFQLTNENPYLDAARQSLDWLAANGSDGYPGLSWGYPFDVNGRGVHTPKGTPVAVVCAIAGEAFLRACAVTGNSEFMRHARAVAAFLTEGLPFLEQGDGTGCFAYGPTDRRRVHNANLLVAAFLKRFQSASGEACESDRADRAIAFSLNAQRPDGAWPYGELSDDEPYEPSLMSMVDHHHTGFVLRALSDIQASDATRGVEEALRTGTRYYRTLFTSSGMPITANGRYPVDIHACAEGILCPSVLSRSLPAARGLALKTIKWTYYHLRRPSDGAPYYRQYPFFRSRLVAVRWGVAWIYWALAEFLYQHFAELPPETGTNS